MTISPPESSLARHIARESLISAAINAVISAGFFFAMFGGVAPVPFWGGGGLVVDAVPQSFMVALMGTLIPGMLMRSAVRRGKIQARSGVTTTRLIGLAVCVAAVAAAGGVLLAAAVGAFTATASFGLAATAKIAYGAVLGWAVTGWALRRLFG